MTIPTQPNKRKEGISNKRLTFLIAFDRFLLIAAKLSKKIKSKNVYYATQTKLTQKKKK